MGEGVEVWEKWDWLCIVSIRNRRKWKGVFDRCSYFLVKSAFFKKGSHFFICEMRIVPILQL